MYDYKDCEKQIIGAIKDNQNYIDDYCITENLFLNPLNRKFFNVMRDLHIEGKKIDSLLVYNKIENTELAQHISHYESCEVFYTENIAFYIERQQNLCKLKNLELLSLYINDWKTDKTPDEIINLIDEKITALTATEENYACKVGECLPSVLDEMQESYQSGGKVTGVKTGFPKLDYKLNGLNKGDYIVLGARPGLGKTSIALCMAYNITAKEKIPTAIISIEMRRNMLIKRLLSSIADINLYSVRSGYLTKTDFMNINTAATIINEIPLYIYDEPGIKLSKLLSVIRAYKRKGIKIFFIDYFTMIRHDDDTLQPRFAYGKISKALKTLAGKLGVSLVVLSQLNRDGEGKAPTMANLKETSELEDDADILLFLHRNREESNTNLTIVKNRNGSTDTIKLYFKKETTTFTELEENINEGDL